MKRSIFVVCIAFTSSFHRLHKIRECKNTLYPPHGQNQNHGFGFWPSVSLFLPVSREEVVLVSGEVVLVFGFSSCLREGVGVFSHPLIKPPWGNTWISRAVPEYCWLCRVVSGMAQKGSPSALPIDLQTVLGDAPRPSPSTVGSPGWPQE